LIQSITLIWLLAAFEERRENKAKRLSFLFMLIVKFLADFGPKATQPFFLIGDLADHALA
jgi:hypothetical protein